MTRLNLTVEGQTEQRFVAELLVPHLAAHGVYTAKPRLTALCKKKGKVHRGGITRYEPAKNDIKMIDLYALPKDFPGYIEAEKSQDPYQRVAALEQAMKDDIGDPRFIPYIQLHEFEALLFAQPEAFECYYDQHKKQIASLATVCNDFENPELIDDGQDTAPSKRIGNQIPEYLAAKPTAGPMIAAEIGLDVIRAKCRHFNEWLTKLEELGAA